MFVPHPVGCGVLAAADEIPAVGCLMREAFLARGYIHFVKDTVCSQQTTKPQPFQAAGGLP